MSNPVKVHQGEHSFDRVTKDRRIISVPLSFETGEQGTIKVPMFVGEKVKILRLKGVVIKALAATDAGTIQAKNNAGTNMTSGLLTFAASDPIGTEVAVVPTANNEIGADEEMQLVTAKTTVGGKVLLIVEYQKISL